jgi:hypothetical protein
LELLIAIEEIGCGDPGFSYFLMREGKEGPWLESGIQTQGGVQRSTAVKVGAE